MIIKSECLVETPVISVHVLVYNHEKYLRKCLDGIFSQKLDLPFEVIIGEDKSTDNSLSICKEYQQKYPENVVLLAQDVNKGLIGNYCDVTDLVRGKFVTGIAGDDYWCDEDKLSKQLAIMNKHPDVGLCYTNVVTCNDEGVENDKPLLDRNFLPDTFEGQLFKTCYMAPNTWLLRTNVFKRLNDQQDWFTDESLATALDFLHESKLYFLNDVTTVYRVRSGSLANQTDAVKKWKYECGIFKMQLYYAKKYHCSVEIIDKIKLQGYVDFSLAAIEAGDNEFVEKALNFYRSKGMELIFFYDKQKTYVKYKRSYYQILKSKSYRIGKMILKPLRTYRTYLELINKNK